MTHDPHMKALVDVLVDVVVRELKTKEAPASMETPGPDSPKQLKVVSDEDYIEARPRQTV